jgi:CheY-like chemotaxis protein
MSPNIFYADDDDEDREMFKDALNEISDHIHLTTHENGTTLIQHLHQTPLLPGLIFLDLNMPLKNGFDVLQEIRSGNSTCSYPVFILTTSNHPEAVEKVKRLGASLFITKPTSFNSLKSILKYVLSKDWQTFIPADKDFVFRIK